MTRILSRVLFLAPILCAVALPALAEEPATTSTAAKPPQVPPGYTLVMHKDGSWEALAPDAAARTAEADRLDADAEARKAEAERIRAVADADVARSKADAEAKALRDETSNGSVIGRASMSAEDLCGLQFDKEATGRRGVQLAELYADCVRAEAVKIDAIGRANNTQLALLLDRDLASEGNESATGSAAVVSALTDDETGSALGYGGFGVAGLPYNASVVGTFQQNALNVQALLAGQSMVVPQTPPAGQQPPPGTTTEKVVVKEVVRAPTQEEIDTAAAKQLQAAGH